MYVAGGGTQMMEAFYIFTKLEFDKVLFGCVHRFVLVLLLSLFFFSEKCSMYFPDIGMESVRLYYLVPFFFVFFW